MSNIIKPAWLERQEIHDALEDFSERELVLLVFLAADDLTNHRGDERIARLALQEGQALIALKRLQGV